MSKLALLGGEKVIKSEPGDLFQRHDQETLAEIKDAVMKVLDDWSMSGMGVTREFERRYADWHGSKYGLGFPNGTTAIQAAMYGAGVGRGDEIICPSMTYWASCLQIYSLGATVVFTDIDEDTLNIDPRKIASRITDRTKAILVVHYAGYPADMDAIMEISRKHSLKVIEDVSHAHGALYKGKMVGTIGDVGAFSLMAGKSFATGEAGIIITDDREIYERALAFGHYNRHNELTFDYLKEGANLPWGGVKGRVNQMCSAIGLVQLKHYPEQIKEIDKAMNYFWDLLSDTPGVRGHRPPKGSNTTKGGWYLPLGLFDEEELPGLSVTRFCEALRAEGFDAKPGCNTALHDHPIFNTVDIYNDGKPTRFANSNHDILAVQGELPVSEGIQQKVFSMPLFYNYRPEKIKEYADAVKKVVANYEEIKAEDSGNPEKMGMLFRY